MTAKIGTVRMERNRAIQGQKDMRKLNRELTRQLAASRALCDQHFNAIIELRAELYSGIPPKLLVIATGYEGGVMVSSPEDLSGTINLNYQSPAEAEAAFECITNMIDAIIANRKEFNAKP